MKMKMLSILVFTMFGSTAFTQIAPFGIRIEPMQIDGLGGLQSYAFGQNNGKWLIIGGRLDGLHRRQPFAAFDFAGHNTQLIVVDPVTKQKWSVPATSLSLPLQEQLRSTNMQFYQAGNYLYLTGGYGYSAIVNDHTTFGNLTAINVPATINAIINGTGFTSNFRQIADPKFQVSGGHLKRINNSFYLIGGHKFIGRYNPMGPDHGPGFIQEYTNQIRKFNLADNGTTITISHFPPVTDSIHLHRRDYNAVPQILPNGAEGITAFSGVFQPIADLPYLNCVNIDSTTYTVNNAFQQFYNHYHCAVLPVYDASKNEMHNIFFGGIAQYYDIGGVLVQDNNVPFVKTIARVTRNFSGTMAEYKLPVEMPVLLGAGAEFIPITTVPQYNNHVIQLNALTADSVLAGYIYGGISSSAENIFFTNTGTESNASSQIYKVYIIKNVTVGVDNLNPQSTGTLQLKIIPNPNNGSFTVKFHLNKMVKPKIIIFDTHGKKVEERILTNVSIGENTFEYKLKRRQSGRIYMLTLETTYENATQKIITDL